MKTKKRYATTAIVEEYIANEAYVEMVKNKRMDFLKRRLQGEHNEHISVLKPLFERAHECHDRNESLDRTYDFSYYMYNENGRVGLKDGDGEVVLPARFDGMMYCPDQRTKNQVLPVIEGGKYLMVKLDGTGESVTKAYDKMERCQMTIDFRVPMYDVQRDGRWGRLKSNGEAIVDDCERVGNVVNGVFTYQKNGKMGYVYVDDFNKINVGEPIYDDVTLHRAIRVEVARGDEQGFVGENGEMVHDLTKAKCYGDSFVW